MNLRLQTQTHRRVSALLHHTQTHLNTPPPDSHSPGTTPFVAIALMEMAVSIVCKEQHTTEEVSGD